MEALIKPIKEAILGKGYEWFDNTPYNVNIVGIRRNTYNKVTNNFDDLLALIYLDSNQDWQLRLYKISTEPGLSVTINPSNPKGIAILVPGQYKGVYKLDLHKGKYMALCQRLGEVKVFRDNNKDRTFDYSKETIESGSFGINIHKAGDQTTEVGNWSEGCQVFSREDDFDEFIAILTNAEKRYGNKFTYTLIEEQDFK